MSKNRESSHKIKYEIKVTGTLDTSWSDWFNGMAITFADNVTTLTGRVSDQSILRGMVNKIWDLNLSLISINQVEEEDQ